jgi:hypothetical protein
MLPTAHSDRLLINYFNSSEPLLRHKQEELDFQDIQGLWSFNCKLGEITLFSAFYSRLDQVFILWGLISSVIFITAQFIPISWSTQAILWSALTLGGTVGMVVLSWFWVSVERLRWIVYCWVILMVGGLALTDLGIFLGWGEVLMRLCPLWLGLSAIGYFCTGLGMRSRTFVLTGVFHLLGIAVLPYFAAWQFLTTGIVMAISLLLLAEFQWDMRPPIDYNLLTPEQKQFNQQQYQLRQMAG